MKNSLAIAFVFLISLASCGGAGSGNGGCTKGSGVYTAHCLSFTCSDGSGSCAANDPVDIQIILQGNGIALTGNWVTDANTFTADGCEQSIVAHETDTTNGTQQTEHLLVSCDASGSSCQLNETLAIEASSGQATCVESATLIKQ